MLTKSWKVLLGCLLGLLLIVPDLFAYPVAGYVDPGFGSGYDLGTSTTGTATYTFDNLLSPYNLNLNGVVLYFEDDVFDVNNTSPVLGSLPTGWVFQPLLDTSAGFLQITLTQGSGIPEGGKLSFQMDFKLWSDALALNWDSGQPWVQPFQVHYTGIDPLAAPSWTAPVPEPMTMLLFGVSMLSAAGYGRYRMSRK
jgi:hypothetical protein